MQRHSKGTDGSRLEHGALALRKYGLLAPEGPAGDPAAERPRGTGTTPMTPRGQEVPTRGRRRTGNGRGSARPLHAVSQRKRSKDPTKGSARVNPIRIESCESFRKRAEAFISKCLAITNDSIGSGIINCE